MLLLLVLLFVLCCRFDAQTAAAVPFHPRFVKYVQNFGVLRFMGWMEANTNQVGEIFVQSRSTLQALCQICSSASRTAVKPV
jgi:hypothetical protein